MWNQYQSQNEAQELEQGRKREQGDGSGKKAEREDLQEEKQDDKIETEHEAGPIISSEYNEEDSGLTILSSDGVHFKVHSVIIRRASSILRARVPAKLPLGGYPLLKLDDAILESSSVVKRFLDLIYRGRDYDLDEWMDWRNVIRLARRWESREAIETLYDAIVLEISNLTSRSCRGVSLFIITVGLEDEYLLREIVSTYKHSECLPTWAGMDYICYGNPKVDDIGQELPHGDFVEYPPALNPGSWTLEEYLSVPPNIIWLLLRACSLRDDIEEIAFDDSGSLGPNDAKIITSYTDSDTDLVLISSDKVSFRVHSTVMKRVSSMFSDMLALDFTGVTPQTIDFTDDLREHSYVIEAILDIIYNFKTPSLGNHTIILHLVDLAGKWGVQVVPHIIRKNLEAAFYGTDVEHFFLFLIAIKLQDYALASAFIERSQVDLPNDSPSDYSGRLHLPYYYGKYLSHIDDPMFFAELDDISTARYQDLLSLPPKIAWALQKAALMWDHGEYDKTKTKASRRKAVAENFRRIVDGTYVPADPPPRGTRGYILVYEDSDGYMGNSIFE